MRVILIHGIHTNGPAPLMGLEPYLLGYECLYPDYSNILGLETLRLNPGIVSTVLPFLQDGDVLIGHSNGGAICYELACATQRRLGKLVLINAALATFIELPATVPAIDVYFNAGDLVTEIAQLGAEIGFDDSNWGAMGHAGYSGTDPKITSIDCGQNRNLPVVFGHSDLFSARNLAAWGPFMAARLDVEIHP